MGRLPRHHMLHTAHHAPLGDVGLRPQLHHKGAVDRQGALSPGLCSMTVLHHGGSSSWAMLVVHAQESIANALWGRLIKCMNAASGLHMSDARLLCWAFVHAPAASLASTPTLC